MNNIINGNLHVYISNDIPLYLDDILNAVLQHQKQPWCDASSDECDELIVLQNLFDYMNSGAEPDVYFYKGDLYRIHTSQTMLRTQIGTDYLILSSSSDTSCHVLRDPLYSDCVKSFSKAHKFSDKKIYNDVFSNERADIFHVKAEKQYGIDLNVLWHMIPDDILDNKYSSYKRYCNEEEVLYPLRKQDLVKWYRCTPNQFDYYYRNRS